MSYPLQDLIKISWELCKIKKIVSLNLPYRVVTNFPLPSLSNWTYDVLKNKFLSKVVFEKKFIFAA